VIHAIKTHTRDFIAIAVLIVLAIGTVAYILEHQPAFTLGRSYYKVNAVFSNAAAVTAGQGQPVSIAGVEVGLVGGVQLEQGQAVVTMDIFKKYAPIYRNATVLLRPRTPLQDMYLALDPGTRSAGSVPAGGTIGIANTQPQVNVDQILGSLDGDTRDYLLLLLSGGADAFNGKGSTADSPSASTVTALRAAFKRFGPIDQGLAGFTKQLKHRTGDLGSAIHNLDLVAGALGSVNGELTDLIKHSSTTFGAISSEDKALQQGLSQLPATLRTTTTALDSANTFASTTGTALTELAPFARNLGPGLKAVRTLANSTGGSITKLQQFSTNPKIRELVSTLEPAAADLSKSAPALGKSFTVLNQLLNAIAYRRKGGEQSYLYWGSWAAHNLDSITSLQDANGSILQGFLMATPDGESGWNILCGLSKGTPSLTPLIDLLHIPPTAGCETGS
jgi:phospholipid/cholesterol/gamma-HCH transport system substrate-binding protein